MFEFFAGGSVLLFGGQTESQGGCVLGICTEEGIKALAKPNGTDIINIEYEEFGSFEMEIGDCEPRAVEAETPAALVRGIMNCFIESGNIFGGFDAKISSDIPFDCGISSNAAFGVLIGKIISGLFFGNSVPDLSIAKFASIAENDYFGNPCGLSERIVSAVGGTVFADFSDPEMPRIQKIRCDFGKSGYAFALIESDETVDFYEKEKDMALIAWNMGYNSLSEAEEAEFIALFPILRQKCGERAVMNALGFFEEKRRAEEMAEALEKEDFEEAGRILEESAERFIGEKNAVKICGKAALTMIPEEMAEAFAEEMEKQGFGVMFVL